MRRIHISKPLQSLSQSVDNSTASQHGSVGRGQEEPRAWAEGPQPPEHPSTPKVTGVTVGWVGWVVAGYVGVCGWVSWWVGGWAGGLGGCGHRFLLFTTQTVREFRRTPVRGRRSKLPEKASARPEGPPSVGVRQTDQPMVWDRENPASFFFSFLSV